MCGITGWVDFRRPIENEKETLKTMADTLSRRGPDASQVWAEGHAGFGHTRLIVVDPAGGLQPMSRTKNNNTYTVCYNGELYNTEDIRKELIKEGYTFLSHSDTEVLLTAFIAWGEKCVEKFNGIFAFAIWNQKEERLFLGRDRLGVKPLFYMEHQTGIVFGSEPKAILAHPEIEAVIDEDGLQELLALCPSRTPGHGVYKGMKELRPAHFLKIDREGRRVNRYWQVKSEKHTQSADETADHIRWLLKDTVERQLVADVPVCTFLSGGVDSSALTALAANYFKEKGRGTLSTYSIDYEENDKYFKSSKFQPNPDAPWIKVMSDFLGSNHHGCVINNDVLFDYLTPAAEARDFPGMADIDSSLLWFSEQIKQDVTVGLSGECADEIFGGYPWFHDEETIKRESFPWMRSVQERQQLLRPAWKDKLHLNEYADKRYTDTVIETPLLDGETELEQKRRALFYLNMTWFMTTLLDRKDRMSMAASLEVRVPFADHRLVEYVWNIPWDMKMYGGREKGILRKALEDVLPHDILYRKKSPYPKTHHPVYTEKVTSALQGVLTQGDSPLFDLFEKRTIRELVDSKGSSFRTPYFGQLMSGPQLIAHLWQFHHWLISSKVKIL
ncbi:MULTISPECIES: asparagine synthase (glutamine-hydrolyzing) [Alteribacter]|uniref:asparagine synthase (glutamine-hydrolyzing) n=1 Tax=Alteribacter keqinensis TaxID=2483800 RepID=A0A3M7TX90_9BACI|nr:MULTISPECIES: asparagine synthase (glutamine-hydrolyzing) [Alteribacter]MBM7097224.1 asparagine synthase (glutamine-hydrolyzing) [Alteribacter salitolerans]RNA69035.1 asparagine synthase (glutamine-hydrolyzing) [Alteribacter keqinensis]